jgi:hypothetical protein
MSDLNTMFDLRVMQNEDGSWSVSLIPPDSNDGYANRLYPSALLAIDADFWTEADLVTVMAVATADIDMALFKDSDAA